MIIFADSGIRLIRKMAVLFGNGDGQWKALPNPLQLTMHAWNDVEIHFDTDASTAEIQVNGQSSGLFPYGNDGTIINYFHISSESAAVAGTSVNLDELIIQDASMPFPSVVRAGGEIDWAAFKAGSANLEQLAINGQPVPHFAPEVTEYTVHVGNRTQEVTVTPRAAYGGAQIFMQVNNGESVQVLSGNASPPAELQTGINMIRVQVIGVNGTVTKMYTVQAVRAAPQADGGYRGPNRSDLVDLSELHLSAGSLEPVFSPKHTQYHVELDHGIASVTVTAATYHTESAVRINESSAVYGLVSETVPLQEGPNVIRIIVSAENGLTKTYMLHVRRRRP